MEKIGGKIYTRYLTAVHRAASRETFLSLCSRTPVGMLDRVTGYGILFLEIFVSSERSSLSKLAPRYETLRSHGFSPIPPSRV